MPDSIDFSYFAAFWLIDAFLAWAIFGFTGYFIATRRIKQPIVVFLVRFGIVFFFFFFLDLAIMYLWPSFYHAIQSCTATLVGGVLDIAGMSHSVSGWTVSVQSSSLAFNIGPGCVGDELCCIYIGLVFAETNATKKQRLVGILMGLAILLAFNLFRVTLSIYVQGLYGFDVHYLFYFFNMIFVLLVWAGWLWTIRRRPTRLARAMP